MIGLAALLVAAYDRRDISAVADSDGVGFDDVLNGTTGTAELGLSVGWGLNLAMGAAFSLVVSSIVLLASSRN